MKKKWYVLCDVSVTKNIFHCFKCICNWLFQFVMSQICFANTYYLSEDVLIIKLKYVFMEFGIKNIYQRAFGNIVGRQIGFSFPLELDTINGRHE